MSYPHIKERDIESIIDLDFGIGQVIICFEKSRLKEIIRISSIPNAGIEDMRLYFISVIIPDHVPEGYIAATITHKNKERILELKKSRYIKSIYIIDRDRYGDFIEVWYNRGKILDLDESGAKKL